MGACVLNTRDWVEVPPGSETLFDAMIGRFRSLDIVLNGDFCEWDIPHFLIGRREIMTMKIRVYWLVNCIRRVGTIKHIAIKARQGLIWNEKSEEDKDSSFQSPEEFLVSLLKPFNQLRGLKSTSIEICSESEYAPLYEDYYEDSEDEEDLAQERSDLVKTLEKDLQPTFDTLAEAMCSQKPVTNPNPPINILTLLESITLGNSLSLDVQKRPPHRRSPRLSRLNYTTETEHFQDAIEEDLIDEDILFPFHFYGLTYDVHAAEDARQIPRSYTAILEAALLACENKDTVACRKESRAIFSIWTGLRRQFNHQWKDSQRSGWEFSDATNEEKRTVREAWEAIDLAFTKLRLMLREESEKLEPEKNALQRELDLDAVFNLQEAHL
ncbi:hypothetical protein EJ08DRAFT_38031 [Tothia fuscella]|uniref:Uncharacterized protein n=1 Tax=Tothia fuscella TaxID=1048955 RepID=A0A9P4NXY2_9PEZI|nr:hypothetical protein EJ08DRAFT_38031 [Tothia fuscella]